MEFVKVGRDMVAFDVDQLRASLFVLDYSCTCRYCSNLRIPRGMVRNGVAGGGLCFAKLVAVSRVLQGLIGEKTGLNCRV